MEMGQRSDGNSEGRECSHIKEYIVDVWEKGVNAQVKDL
jgi:hypothetical protein